MSIYNDVDCKQCGETFAEKTGHGCEPDGICGHCKLGEERDQLRVEVEQLRRDAIARREAEIAYLRPENPHKEWFRSEACPCLHTTPCQSNCSCVRPHMSHGCLRCCSYGSKEQQKARAEAIVAEVTQLREIVKMFAEYATCDIEDIRYCAGTIRSECRQAAAFLLATKGGDV